MRLILCCISMFGLLFSVAAYGMEERGVLREVRAWCQRDPSLEERVYCGELDKEILRHIHSQKIGKKKKKKSGSKKKFASRGQATPSKTRGERLIGQCVSDDPLLQKLYAHWSTVGDVQKKSMAEGVVDEIRRKFLDGSDAEVIERMLQAYMVRYEKKTSQAAGGLYHKQVQYFGMPLHLVHDSKAWYLFGEKLGTDQFSKYFRKLRNDDKTQEGVALWLLPYNDENEHAYFFAGPRFRERLVFCKILGAKTPSGGRWRFVKKDGESPAQYPPPSIEPEMGDGTRHEEEAIHDECLAQLGELQRKAVRGGQRNGDYKP